MVKTLDRWRYTQKLKIGCDQGAKGSNSAATRGIAYHRKVFKALEANPIPGMELMVEPWFQKVDKNRFCQPDSLFIDHAARTALVIEVKMNWKDGRDEKLHELYLPVVRNAFDLDIVWPLLITQNIRGYEHPPLLGLDEMVEAMAWTPNQPTPLLLYP